ncbi:PREDICTED: venom allergen 3-like [Vollenhovia emeryi]|uniref:venom allergen 3-like n=1 Tax=Vollenhovia emeryi TaxID=411798 RepID=UPI0005F44C8F|nr:PREDICTED: venom allergen 3-like [Vollenhovia emeryi]
MWLANFKWDTLDTSESTSYTQIVWANTTKIGCGQIEYYTMDGEWKYYFVVCNYGPSGNVIGDLIYEAKV